VNPTVEDLIRAIPRRFFPGPKGFTKAQAKAAQTAINMWAKRASADGTVTASFLSSIIGGNCISHTFPNRFSLHGYHMDVDLLAKFGEEGMDGLLTVRERDAVTVKGRIATMKIDIGYKTQMHCYLVLDDCRLAK